MKDTTEIKHMLHVMNSPYISFLKMNKFTFLSGTP